MNHNFGNTVFIAINPRIPLKFEFANNAKLKKETRNSCSRSKSHVRFLNENFNACQNQTHPNEQPPTYPVNCFSCNSFVSRKCSISTNRFSPYQSSEFRSLSTSPDRSKNSHPRYCHPNIEFNPNRTPSRKRYTGF